MLSNFAKSAFCSQRGHLRWKLKIKPEFSVAPLFSFCKRLWTVVRGDTAALYCMLDTFPHFCSSADPSFSPPNGTNSKKITPDTAFYEFYMGTISQGHDWVQQCPEALSSSDLHRKRVIEHGQLWSSWKWNCIDIVIHSVTERCLEYIHPNKKKTCLKMLVLFSQWRSFSSD